MGLSLQVSMEWKHNDSPVKKEFQTQQSVKKKNIY